MRMFFFLVSLVSTGIKAVFGPVLSKVNEKEQKTEWHNISNLGNIEELTRVASDTAGLITLYYREQIQIIDPWRKIKGSNAFSDKLHILKRAYDVRPEAPEERAIVLAAEYILTWIIDALKLGKEKIDPTEPLPQQLWLCVAQKDPFEHGHSSKTKESLGISIGQLRIPLKIKELPGTDTSYRVQLRYLIGCVSVLGRDGYIYQFDVSKVAQDEELRDLKLFGYVYITPFGSDEKFFKSVIEGRRLKPARRDENGDILTRFDDINRYAQIYAVENDPQKKQSFVHIQTANQVAQILKEQGTIVDHNELRKQLKSTHEAIELTVGVLREDIQEKTDLFQTSIDAAYERIALESKTNRETMQKDNQSLYEQNRKKLKEYIREMQDNLLQTIEQRFNAIQQQMQLQTQQMLSIAETSKAQSQQAIQEANQATQISQQMLNKATEATTSAQSLAQLADRQRQDFVSKMNTCEATVKETAAQQKQVIDRNMADLRTKFEQDSDRSKRSAQESAASAQQAQSSAQEIERMTRKQLDIQKKETDKTVAEAKEAEKQARRAADAAAAAVSKVNDMHDKVERALQRK